MAALLNTDPNMAAPDDFYDELIRMHHGLTDAQSALVNAKLILLLANHIGDADILRAAMAAAREDVTAENGAVETGCGAGSHQSGRAKSQ